ncbi:hypothetical protein FJY93_02740 [Candidatus Kaiserbacteria bacterium]|nr:hypothetical protein [Candidatus Kaiserbacteria bacterium]
MLTASERKALMTAGKITLVRNYISMLPPQTQISIKAYEEFIDKKLEEPTALRVDGFELFGSWDDSPGENVLNALTRLYEAGGYHVTWRSARTDGPKNMMCLEYPF